MISVEQIIDILRSTGFRVAYRVFKKPPPMPYIVFYEISSQYTGSDFENHIVRTIYTAELYTKVRDTIAEAKIEQVLNFAPLSKSEDYIDDEQITVVSYDFEIVQKIKEKNLWTEKSELH